MSDLQLGPHTRRDDSAHNAAEGSPAFDREINLRVILSTGAGLVAVTVVFCLLMWWLVRGFERFDERRDPRPTPIEAANPQQPPPEPRLQVAPGFAVINPGESGRPVARSDREDMLAQRQEEDRALSQPAWIDPAQGKLRVPIDVAMKVIAARGAAPEVVGGHAGAAGAAGIATTPNQMRLQTEAGGVPGAGRNPKPGLTLQSTAPPNPARPPH
jgi:hypothetical protein